MTRLTPARITAIALMSAALSGCITVSMPKIDIMKTPEFADDAANIGNAYPDLAEAPSRPADVRTDAAWDEDAERLLALRTSFPEASPEDQLTQAEIDAEFADRLSKVRAYKAGDPPGGID